MEAGRTDRSGRRSSAVSVAMGDYLKALWEVGGEGANTGQLAGLLSVSGASVTRMLGRLRALGFVEYQPYGGARLTPEGTREALRLVRRHRLIETFLVEHLGYSWDEVHDEAELMEHVMSDRFTERLAALLGHPDVDPHGDPIPLPDGSMPLRPDRPLTGVAVGAGLRVCRLRTQDSDILAYFARIGLVPGQVVGVRAIEPHGHMLTLDIAGGETVLSRELAELVEGEEFGAAVR